MNSQNLPGNFTFLFLLPLCILPHILPRSFIMDNTVIADLMSTPRLATVGQLWFVQFTLKSEYFVVSKFLFFETSTASPWCLYELRRTGFGMQLQDLWLRSIQGISSLRIFLEPYKNISNHCGQSAAANGLTIDHASSESFLILCHRLQEVLHLVALIFEDWYSVYSSDTMCGRKFYILYFSH